MRTRFAVLVFFASSWVAAETLTLKSPAILHIHSKTLTPSSDALFVAESSAPDSESAWTSLEKNALTLARGANELSSIPAAKGTARWRGFAGDLATRARNAARAARSHDLNALVAANGEIVAACEACHDEYRDAGHGMTSDARK